MARRSLSSGHSPRAQEAYFASLPPRVEGGGREPGGMGPPFAFITRLRWEGHELLDSMRGDTTWNRIKATAREKSVDLTVDTIKMIGKIVLEGLLRG